MIRLKRRNVPWLVFLGAVIFFALSSGAASAPLAAVLLMVFTMAVVASVMEFGQGSEDLFDAIKKAPIRQRVSAEAKEAAEQAKSNGGYINSDLMVLDLGLIASQSSYEGMAMRRTRNISKDDDGVRPFLSLFVDDSEAERNAVIRYEVYNQYGEQKYVHEMKTFLRAGEMNLMADHHLPLAGNEDVDGAGDWDLRVYIDGNLAAQHNFMLTPSIRDRSRRLAADRGYDEVQSATPDYYQIIDEVPQESAPTMKDLLNEPKTSRTPNTGSTSSRATTDAPRPRVTTRRRR